MKVINLESAFNTRDLSALKIENKRIALSSIALNKDKISIFKITKAKNAIKITKIFPNIEATKYDENKFNKLAKINI